MPCQDPDPGWTSRSLETIFWVKNTYFLWRGSGILNLLDPGSLMEKFVPGIRDKHPGSATQKRTLSITSMKVLSRPALDRSHPGNRWGRWQAWWREDVWSSRAAGSQRAGSPAPLAYLAPRLLPVLKIKSTINPRAIYNKNLEALSLLRGFRFPGLNII